MGNREKLDSFKKFSDIISQVYCFAEKGMALENIIQTKNEKLEKKHKEKNELQKENDRIKRELFYAKKIIKEELKKEIEICSDCGGEGGYMCAETGEGYKCDVCNGYGLIIKKLIEKYGQKEKN